jgi:hypothetical protein
MKNNTPKKAVNKSKQAKEMIAAALQAEMLQQQMPIDPEIQSAMIDMQTPTTNPYHADGQMAPTAYEFANRLDGYNMPAYLMNPEA